MGTKKIIEDLKLFFTLMDYETSVSKDKTMFGQRDRITLVAENNINYIYIDIISYPVYKQIVVNYNNNELLSISKTYDKLHEAKDEIQNALKKIDL